MSGLRERSIKKATRSALGREEQGSIDNKDFLKKSSFPPLTYQGPVHTPPVREAPRCAPQTSPQQHCCAPRGRGTTTGGGGEKLPGCTGVQTSTAIPNTMLRALTREEAQQSPRSSTGRGLDGAAALQAGPDPPRAVPQAPTPPSRDAATPNPTAQALTQGSFGTVKLQGRGAGASAALVGSDLPHVSSTGSCHPRDSLWF